MKKFALIDYDGNYDCFDDVYEDEDGISAEEILIENLHRMMNDFNNDLMINIRKMIVNERIEVTICNTKYHVLRIR